MILGHELWFGALQAVENELLDRIQKSKSLFDALLLETYGLGHSRYRGYLDRFSLAVPDPLNTASDTHVAISGFLVARAETPEQAQTYAKVLDCGLKKVTLKHPATGMPGFANDWKLLLGAAMGTKSALDRGLEGDWNSHRDFILNSVAQLARPELMSATVDSFIQSRLGEEPPKLLIGRRDAAGLTVGELICVAWAYQADLACSVSEAECWNALQEAFATARVHQLTFHELSFLFVVLKENWASGWIERQRDGIGFVKAALRDFLPCAKRDVKTQLIRNEADVQRIIWTMLRPTFSDLVDEDYLPRFGAKNYKPDFGIPSLRLLIEAKYVRQAKSVAEIQDELQTDIIGYLSSTSDYNSIIFLIYDTKGDVAANTGLHTAIRQKAGVEDVIVVVGPSASEQAQK